MTDMTLWITDWYCPLCREQLTSKEIHCGAHVKCKTMPVRRERKVGAWRKDKKTSTETNTP